MTAGPGEFCTPVRASRYATCERPHRARYAVKNGDYQPGAAAQSPGEVMAARHKWEPDAGPWLVYRDEPSRHPGRTLRLYADVTAPIHLTR